MIKSEGIELEFSDSISFEISGKLQHVGIDNWKITINNKQIAGRQRFAMAHEFAHYCLHRNYDDNFLDVTFFISKDVESNIEKEANEFAYNLLIPESLIRKQIYSGVTSIAELSQLFNVTPLAMKIRLSSLGYKFKKQ